ncbi:MAG: hypothetical protein H7263_06455, partial [Candidatus Sericytochromatia bacterium]|nr:hypothetical protein [Candidatus Sericytochromatia bacterium]
MMKKILLVLSTLFSLTISTQVFSEEIKVEKKDIYPKMNLNLEYGFLSVLDHKIQFSKNNTYFDYVKDGGQNNLFNVAKLSADFQFNPQHSLVFLYQPLAIETQGTLAKEIKEENVTFAQ